jgi:hypothetical protein
LNQALKRIHKNKPELLIVLERPDVPLHNNTLALDCCKKKTAARSLTAERETKISTELKHLIENSRSHHLTKRVFRDAWRTGRMLWRVLGALSPVSFGDIRHFHESVVRKPPLQFTHIALLDVTKISQVYPCITI